MKKFSFSLSLWLAGLWAVYPEPTEAQGLPASNDSIQFLIERSTPLTLDLAKEDSVKIISDKKKKRVKKNVFYGYKSKRGFTKTGFGDNATVEIFYYLKKW